MNLLSVCQAKIGLQSFEKYVTLQSKMAKQETYSSLIFLKKHDNLNNCLSQDKSDNLFVLMSPSFRKKIKQLNPRPM